MPDGRLPLTLLLELSLALRLLALPLEPCVILLVVVADEEELDIDTEGKEDSLKGGEGVLDHERGRGTFSQESSTSHEPNPVGTSCLLNVVGGDNHRLALKSS